MFLYPSASTFPDFTTYPLFGLVLGTPTVATLYLGIP